MNKYLLEILKDTNTIIIPGLGALTITNKELGEIMFMPYLKHDDGKLSGYIASKDGIDEADAKNLVAKYVREIQNSLDKGDSYDMFEFGTFIKNAAGDIEFSSWQRVKTIKKTAPVPKVETRKKEVKEEKKAVAPKKKAEPKSKVEEKKPAKKFTPAIKPVAKKETTSKSKSKTESEVKPKAEAEKAPAKNVTPKAKAETAKEKIIVPIVPIVPRTSPKEPVEAVKKPIEKITKDAKDNTRKLIEKEIKTGATKNKNKKEKKAKKKRGAGFWILMVVLALLIGGGTFFGMNYDEYKQYVPFLADNNSDDADADDDVLDKMKETMGEEESNGPDEIIDDPETSEEPGNEPDVEEPPVENTPSPVTSSENGPYHVIAGAFSSKVNADRLAKKLQDAGLPASVIMNGGMHTVSMKSFESVSDANASLAEMKGHSSGAWVLYKN